VARMRPGAVAALVGVASAALALGMGELLAGVLAVPSPVTAVAQQVVPLAPPRVTGWAIDTLGGATTPLLEVGTVTLSLAIGGGLGLLAGRRPSIASAGFAVAGIVGWSAIAAQPDTSPVGAFVVAAGAAGTGAAVLRTLLARTGPVDVTRPARGADEADRPATAGEGRGTGAVAPTDPSIPRRSVLTLAAGAGALAVVGAVGGRVVLSRLRGGTDPASIAMPAPARALGPVPEPARLDVAGITPLHTPTDDFFRIDTVLAVPRVDLDGWRLRIHGRVDRDLELSYDDLLAERLVEVDATLACVSNEVGGSLIGTARWTGVRLDELLARAGPTATAEQVLSRSVDGFTAGFPLEAALDGRDAIVAVAMNGEPLPVRHGFPARLVVPGLFGYVSATKWLEEIELTAWEGVDGYWVPRGWAKQAPIKTGSRIDVPFTEASVPAGRVVLAGVAWAGGTVDRVEVEVDGAWQQAEISQPLAEDTWVQWRTEADLGPGRHQIRVRAVDGRGRTQSAGPVPPRPDGAEGWHTREIVVT
jgi:DMSO/TMAO reductase YedYZ molybdopterin-dependent catalytic subunit